MPTEVPYMMSVTNVPAILEKIRTAGTPPKFTHEFLKSTLGFSSSNDRAITKVLRSLGFLSADGVPTQRYNDYRGEQPGQALAAGLREGWADFFLADESIYQKTPSQIQEIAKNLTGASDSVAKKIATTFKAFSDKSDWSTPSPKPNQYDAAVDSSREEREPDGATERDHRKGDQNKFAGSGNRNDLSAGLFELHHDVHIHLPPTTDVSVYRAIFQAIKAELM